MIRILQWGKQRSICKVYNKNEQNEYIGYKLMIINNQEIVNLEELENVQVIDHHLY